MQLHWVDRLLKCPHNGNAGPNHTGAIVGGVLGALAAVAVVGSIATATVWSRRSYGFRARKRLIEDQVHTIVLGKRSQDLYTSKSDVEAPESDDSQKVSP